MALLALLSNGLIVLICLYMIWSMLHWLGDRAEVGVDADSRKGTGER